MVSTGWGLKLTLSIVDEIAFDATLHTSRYWSLGSGDAAFLQRYNCDSSHYCRRLAINLNPCALTQFILLLLVKSVWVVPADRFEAFQSSWKVSLSLRGSPFAYVDADGESLSIL